MVHIDQKGNQCVHNKSYAKNSGKIIIGMAHYLQRSMNSKAISEFYKQNKHKLPNKRETIRPTTLFQHQILCRSPRKEA